jgi:hypothetical protein
MIQPQQTIMQRVEQELGKLKATILTHPDNTKLHYIAAPAGCLCYRSKADNTPLMDAVPRNMNQAAVAAL